MKKCLVMFVFFLLALVIAVMTDGTDNDVRDKFLANEDNFENTLLVQEAQN